MFDLALIMACIGSEVHRIRYYDYWQNKRLDCVDSCCWLFVALHGVVGSTANGLMVWLEES